MPDMTEVAQMAHRVDDRSQSMIGYVNSLLLDDKAVGNIAQVCSAIEDELADVKTAMGTKLDLKLQHDVDLKLCAKEIEAKLQNVQQTYCRLQASTTEAAEYLQRFHNSVSALNTEKDRSFVLMNFLKRLHVYMKCLDQWPEACAQKDYDALRVIVAVCNRITRTLEPYKDHPKIQALVDRYKVYLDKLKAHLIEEMLDQCSSRYHNSPLSLQLCRVVDAVSPSFRREVLIKYASSVLHSAEFMYPSTSCTSPSEAIQLLERKFTKVKQYAREFRTLREQEFPTTWQTLAFVCERYCIQLREQLIDMLASSDIAWDAESTFTALTKTHEFEHFLDEFLELELKDSVAPIRDPLMELDIRDEHLLLKTFRKQLLYSEILDQPEETAAEPDPLDKAKSIKFKGILINCFGSYMGLWLRAEERRLLENVDRAIANDSYISDDILDEIESFSSRSLRASAIEVLVSLKTAYKRISSITNGQILKDYLKILRNVLTYYLKCISAELRKVHPQTTSSTFYHVTCSIHGTIEYISMTIPLMSATISKLIDPTFSSSVNFSKILATTDGLKNEIISILSGACEKEVHECLDQIWDYNSQMLTKSSRESPWLHNVFQICDAHFNHLQEHCSIPFFLLLCDNFIKWFCQAYYQKLSQGDALPEFVASQLLADTKILKNYLKAIPCKHSDGAEPTTVYSKVLSRDLKKIEIILETVNALQCNEDIAGNLIHSNRDLLDQLDLKIIEKLGSKKLPKMPSLS